MKVALKFNARHPDEALGVGAALCRAVASLHDVGLIHGHLTNTNVFFGEDDPIVVDAWMGHPTAATVHLACQKPGTRGSMAPEQLSGRGEVSTRTDVWQLGVLLCRLYTGKPDIVVNPRILMELYNAKLPAALIKVLWQAIQEEPENRFPDASTLAVALGEVTLAEHQRTVYVRPAPPPAKGVQDAMSPGIRNAAIVVVIIALMLGGAWLVRERSAVAAAAPVPAKTASIPTAAAPAPTPVAVDARLLRPRFTFETNLGKFEVELYGDTTPIASANFARLVTTGAYDGVAFDRVVPNFVVQAGQFTAAGDRKASPFPPVRNEWLNGEEAVVGTIGMGRLAQEPDSITSAFFISVADNRPIFGGRKDGTGEVIFGRIARGMDVIEAISRAKTRNPARGDFFTQPAVYITTAYLSAGFDAAAVISALDGQCPRPQSLAGGIVAEDVVVGRGRPFDPAKGLTMHFVLKASDGTVLDSTRVREQPSSFKVDGYPKSLQLGLQGMRTGGRRIITIPAAIVHGEKAIPGIPAGSGVVYDVHLISQ